MKDTDTQTKPNYYKTIQKHLGKQYPSLSKKEVDALCRETIFAPRTYNVDINGHAVEINTVRENLADYVERRNSEASFIPYSLDTEIADLIESTNCETSSMNEYYRWVSATAEIVNHAKDGNVTDEDIKERNDFIKMSNDRESEILLCLALYEAADPVKNKEKIDMLKFKLARLREMRNIVRNTSSTRSKTIEQYNKEISSYCQYCRELLNKNANFNNNINLKLNLNHDYTDEEDLSEDFSYLDHLKRIILYMMRQIENVSTQHQRPEPEVENINTKQNQTSINPSFPQKQDELTR